MNEKLKFRVNIPAMGKADVVIEAEDSVSAVVSAVSDFARRCGEKPHVMARRLEKIATVTTPTGAKIPLNIIEAFADVKETAPEIVAQDTIADDIREGIAESLRDDDDRFEI